jgi:L-ascorbate metabolism protein UlaG (beta-lactamase superfamily)
MKVNYHYHSGVSVESGGNLYIFDYYSKGIDPNILDLFDNVYVFVSHAHRDHFDKSILKWDVPGRNMKYILSSDVKITKNSSELIVVKPGDSIEIDGITVTALESTDEGVAYLVSTSRESIFHSGDLNWWHWEGEPDDYNMQMAEKYKSEIDKLKGIPIDIAFIPVDKRLEGSMFYAIDYLMTAVDIRMVCPIHFWDDWEYIRKVKEELKDREYYNKIHFYGR